MLERALRRTLLDAHTQRREISSHLPNCLTVKSVSIRKKGMGIRLRCHSICTHEIDAQVAYNGFALRESLMYLFRPMKAIDRLIGNVES